MLGVKSTNVPMKGEFAVQFCNNLLRVVANRQEKSGKDKGMNYEKCNFWKSEFKNPNIDTWRMYAIIDI